MRKSIIVCLKTIVILGSISLLYIRCDEVRVGYLETLNAVYVPDSMVVKAVLDSIEDEHRIKYGIPWQSSTIEGIQGTMPLKYSVFRIDADNNYEDVITQFKIVRKGVIELPWDHSVPPGRYVVSIEVYNEGYSHRLDSVYTVIVK